MRIISSFHDYYDCVAKQGVDQSLLYIREETAIDFVLPTSNWRERNCLFSDYYLQATTCFVGGKFHTILQWLLPNTERIEWLWVRDEQELQEEIQQRCSKDAIKHYMHSRHNYERFQYGFKVPIRKRVIEGLAFLENQHPFIAAAAEKHHAPILIHNHYWRTKHGKHFALLNGKLSNYNFQKTIDPWTCFQDIAVWLGAQASPEKPIPTIDDKTMSEAKGFNKYSFRKDKAIK